MNVASISKTGGRRCNQDYVDYAVAEGAVCVAVADGLGAYHGSEFAGETAVKAALKCFRKAVRRDDDIFSGAFMNKLFKYAHAAIHKIKSVSPELRQGCTTLSVAIVRDDKMICAHEGDTRIYFFRDGKTEFFSKDHSLARLAADRGEISYDDIRTHKDQNKLTRVIGSDYFVQPDFKLCDGVKSGDALLVCTDGFWEYVYEADMEKAIAEVTDAALILSSLEKILVSRAPENNDNYTALIVLFGGDNSFSAVSRDDENDESDDESDDEKSEKNADDDKTSGNNADDKTDNVSENEEKSND